MNLIGEKVAPLAAPEDPWPWGNEGYRVLFESAPMALFVCDREGTLQLYNRRAVELWGREPRRGVEKHCGSLRLYLPDGTPLPHERSPVVGVLRTGIGARNIEVSIERPDGSRLPVMVGFAALKDSRGEIVGALASFVDITDHKQTEQRLREAEVSLRDAQARLVAGASAASVGTWVWDVAANRVFADGYLAKLFNVTEEQAEGGPIEVYFRAIHPADLPEVRAMIERTVDRGRLYKAEYRLGSGDGWRWFSARGEVDRDESGRALRFTGALIDITERRGQEEKLAELSRQLKAQAEMFDLTLSHITDFAYIFNREGRFEFVNKALLDLWGLKLEEAVGKNFFDLQYPDELAVRLQGQIKKVIDTKRGLTDETPYTSPTGAGGYYEYIFRPVFGADGEVTAVAGSTREITDRKRGEQSVRDMEERAREAALELSEAQAELESRVLERTAELAAANKALTAQINEARRAERVRKKLQSQLASVQEDERSRISRELHDEIGQLLVALRLELNAVERNGIPASAASRCQSLREIVDTVASEIHEIAHKLRPTALDDLGLVRTLSNYVQEWSARANVAVGFHVEGLADTRLAPEIETTLYRIAQEALNNVLRHAEATRVSLIIEREAELVRMILEDDGTGFEVDSAGAPQTTGRLGLLGMKERAALVGGELTVESRPKQGTTLFVRIPLSGKDAND